MPSIEDLLRQQQRQIADLQTRVTLLENGSAGSSAPDTYDPNVITNGDMESGITGWSRWFWTGTLGTTSVETTAPIDGTRSLKLTEAAASSTRITWLPSGNSAAPTVGSDVFRTNAGDVWLVQAVMNCSVATTHARIYAICGVNPGDCYGLVSSTTAWVNAADVPLTANTSTVLSGTITIPTSPVGLSYVTFSCSPDDAAGTSGTAWSWLLDDVALRKKVAI